MNIDTRVSLLALAIVCPLIAGCETTFRDTPEVAAFGEPNRQTMAAQVIDPDPVYAEPAATSAEHAGQAVDRYRDDKVKQPLRTTTTSTGSGPN